MCLAAAYLPGTILEQSRGAEGKRNGLSEGAEPQAHRAGADPGNSAHCTHCAGQCKGQPADPGPGS